ncbi:hypothetical protein B1813_18925 [Saccharomonospora piscinae]|uniref:Uncharacterized protein n=1 Tax=Saccharomonospora piscinae TaxID=687388 RepID=A0A1V8ZYD4_SACPI|nr:hypothetical protein [Saccharomonospora piscinae]OQO89915.1 hypothetical protein B1813_18925 [Saccharomonospora piscinae]
MSDLVPFLAREAANAAFWRVEDEHDLVIGDLCADFVGPILAAAAPHIIAAELHRLDKSLQAIPRTSGDPAREAGVDRGFEITRATLRHRAAELTRRPADV